MDRSVNVYIYKMSKFMDFVDFVWYVWNGRAFLNNQNTDLYFVKED